MTDWILLALAALNLLILVFMALALRRRDDRTGEQARAQELATGLRDAARSESDRLQRELRDDMGRHAQASRGDLATFQQMLLNQSGDVARTQNEQIDSFRT